MTRDPDTDEDDTDETTTYEDDHPDPGIASSPDPESEDDAPEETVMETPSDPHPEGTRKIEWVRRGDLVLEYRFWINPRTLTGLAEPDLADLTKDIVRRTVQRLDGGDIMVGIQEPLDVVLIDARGVTIQLVIDGQRRCLAVDRAKRELGDDALVPVIYRDPTPVQWTQEIADKYLAEVLGVVGMRRDLSSYELSEAAQRLEGTRDPDTSQIRTNVQIAEIIRRSPSWVSKILTARRSATPTLLAQWRRGQLTEEQFRDLATSAKPQQQSKEAERVIAARESGDKSAARRAAKELKEQSRAAKAETTKSKPKPSAKPVKPAKGQQAELPIAPPAPSADAKPKAPKPLSYVVIEDLLETTRKRPPTSDMVKGILLGIRVASGVLDMRELPRPWHQYVDRLSAAAQKKKKKK